MKTILFLLFLFLSISVMGQNIYNQPVRCDKFKTVSEPVYRVGMTFDDKIVTHMNLKILIRCEKPKECVRKEKSNKKFKSNDYKL